MAAEARIEAEGLTDFARPSEKNRTLLSATPAPNCRVARNRLARPDQHGSALPVSIGDEIEHLVEAVTQIHIGATRRPPHRRISCGEASATVVRAVIGISIRFDFGDTQANVTMPDLLTEQVSGHVQSVTRVESTGKQAARHGRSVKRQARRR